MNDSVQSTLDSVLQLARMNRLQESMFKLPTLIKILQYSHSQYASACSAAKNTDEKLTLLSRSIIERLFLLTADLQLFCFQNGKQDRRICVSIWSQVMDAKLAMKDVMQLEDTGKLKRTAGEASTLNTLFSKYKQFLLETSSQSWSEFYDKCREANLQYSIDYRRTLTIINNQMRAVAQEPVPKRQASEIVVQESSIKSNSSSNSVSILNSSSNSVSILKEKIKILKHSLQYEKSSRDRVEQQLNYEREINKWPVIEQWAEERQALQLRMYFEWMTMFGKVLQKAHEWRNYNLVGKLKKASLDAEIVQKVEEWDHFTLHFFGFSIQVRDSLLHELKNGTLAKKLTLMVAEYTKKATLDYRCKHKVANFLQDTDSRRRFFFQFEQQVRRMFYAIRWNQQISGKKQPHDGLTFKMGTQGRRFADKEEGKKTFNEAGSIKEVEHEDSRL